MSSDLWYYYYKIKFFDGYEKQEAEGITCGETWQEVAKNLVETYGEANIVEIFTAILGDGNPCFEIRDFNDAFKEQGINLKFS
jgi:hypothetical protein